MQLFKLLRFLNEVESTEQTMFSSVTESQQNLTQLSLADSGTGMSEEDQNGESAYFRNDVIDYTPAVRPTPRINYVHDLQRDVTPDRGSTAVDQSPKIIINTKRPPSSVRRPGFKLKSPKKSSPFKMSTPMAGRSGAEVGALTSPIRSWNPFRAEVASTKSSSDTISSNESRRQHRRGPRPNRRSNHNMSTFKPSTHHQ